MIIIALSLFVFTGCSAQTDSADEQVSDIATHVVSADVPSDMLSTINDWILGTEYGIETIEFDGSTYTIAISEEKQAGLADYERDDIRLALMNIGKAFGFTGCEIVFSDGTAVMGSGEGGAESTQSEQADVTSSLPAEGDTVNLIFIHHSVGENWLNDGLCEMLNANNIHVSDTYYGWSDMGDYTDTEDWPRWFNDDVMPNVYHKLDTETASNGIAPGEGENTIIMFKSCFPNSEVGKSIDDEKAIYDSLLSYFAKHPDKMFVLITSPPMQKIRHPEKTRELTNYLVDKNGWLKDYSLNNVYVFDLYNVLTAPENHHWLIDGTEEHVVTGDSNTLYYDSGGDDHPSTEGNIKATEEFVPLLLYWYDQFLQ
ncbi:MAG: hypothetical protein AB1Z19_04480, partial [Eubacteriales bacterium]